MDLKAQKEEKKVRVVAVDKDGGKASGELPVIADYQVLELIGKGSLTSVYKVRRQGIDTVFVAKVLHTEMAGNPRTAKRFVQEGDKAVGLNDPHLVSVYATAYTSDGRPALICDFIQGENLADRLKRVQKLSEGEVLTMLKQLLPALALAHKNKSIHRDIKPANIVFDIGKGAEIIKLTDFGIAKVMPSVGRETKYITPEGEAFGNPTYMAPEQLQGAKLDARSDMYSLACLLYECLTGAPPFKSSNPVRLALKQLQNEPPPLDGQVGIALASVIMRMLRKDPIDRYQSVDDLIKDLRVVEKGGKPKIPPLKPKPEALPSVVKAPRAKAKEKGKATPVAKKIIKETAEAKALRYRREERLFVASLIFFFFSLIMCVPALFYRFATPPLNAAQYAAQYTALPAEVYERKYPIKHLYNAYGKAVAEYRSDDLAKVLSELRYGKGLRGLIMQDKDLAAARLSHLDLTEARISNCSFFNADLHNSLFSKTTFVGCNFDGTNLSGCEFAGARFYRCSFRGVITGRDNDDRLLEDSDEDYFEGNSDGRLHAVPPEKRKIDL